MKKISIYLDNCCFNRPYDNQESIKIKLESDAKLYIQEKIKDGGIELVWSYMLDLENYDNPFEDKKKNIQAWKIKSTADIDENSQVLNKAETIFQNGLKNKDALHISCAIHSKAEYFITTDDGILRKANFITEIQIVSPIEFINKLEGS